MSAAHELAERGFDVLVCEKKAIPGGKARSLPIPGTGTEGRRDLPGEHGFRFFPGFYRHLPDTMKRIPYKDQRDGVLGNLVTSSRVQIAQAGAPEVVLPARFPQSFSDLRALFEGLVAAGAGVPASEVAYFVGRLLVLLTSCEERRFAEYERMGWLAFSGAETRSPEYRKFLADGLTRTLAATRAREISARTGGSILLQILFDSAKPFGGVDRVLSGPTNDVWIYPWLQHLRRMGVDYRLGTGVVAFHCRRKRITKVVVEKDGVREDIEADFYIAALPVEVMRMLVTDAMANAEPNLARLRELQVRWMNGVQFYLRNDIPMIHGHTIYIDSPWALTSISQAQFWDGVDLGAMGDGRVSGILSVDVSDWEKEGLSGKKAMNCTKREVIEEVWAQLKAHLNDDATRELDDANLVTAFVDPDIQRPNPRGASVNLEPLLINTVGSWDARPDATIGVENLFLAADYVRTHTDLATMEAANEAARRAVNAILDAAGSREPKCDVWPLSEPEIFAPMRLLDKARFELGLPHDGAPGP